MLRAVTPQLYKTAQPAPSPAPTLSRTSEAVTFNQSTIEAGWKIHHDTTQVAIVFAHSPQLGGSSGVNVIDVIVR
jgi:hypothetical protein